MSRAIPPLSPKYFMIDHLYVGPNFIMEIREEHPPQEHPMVGAASENLAIFYIIFLDDRIV